MNKIPQAKLVWALYQLLNETFIRHMIVWNKEIGDEEPYYSIKISIFSFLGGLVWLLYTKQAQCNEGCAKLTSRSVIIVGLDRTGHMSFLTGQDQTPKFAG